MTAQQLREAIASLSAAAVRVELPTGAVGGS
jgi:hypothetical protein